MMAKVMPWKISLRLYSNWIFIALAVVNIGQQIMPELQHILEPRTWDIINSLLAIAGIILRNIPQPTVQEKVKEHNDAKSGRNSDDSDSSDFGDRGPTARP